ncbi:MAG: sulfotransferase [Oceanococcus sp.]
MEANNTDIEVAVFGAVEEILTAIGEDADDELTPDLKLIQDLEFESIDFVQLIVVIEQRLGQKVGFQDMLMQDGKYVQDLSIQQIIDFTNNRLNNPETAASAPAAPTAAPLAANADQQRITEADVSRFVQLIKPRHIASNSTARKNPRAVFILSPPRSGSTLLRVMIAGNPALFAPPELHLLSYATMADRAEDLSGERGDQLSDGVLRALMQNRNWTHEQAKTLLTDSIDKSLSTQAFYNELQVGLGNRLLVDKTPTYAFSTNILQQAESYFEDPLYIHLMRHPCGMIRSYEESDLTRMMPLLMQSSEFSSAAVAEMIWLLSNRNIMQFSESVPADRWCSISYENIVSEPESQMRRLCEFMDVEYHNDMINPYSDNKARMTDGADNASKMSGDLKFHLHSQIDPAAATRWRQFRSEDMLGDATLGLVSKLDQDVARIRL